MDTYLPLVIGALATAVIGGGLSLFWDAIKRQRESDLVSREDYYRAYAEFFTTWKLWDAHKGHGTPAPDDVQWQLLEKAEDAEATFEALLVKLTSEQQLSPADCEYLAAFRQGYQTLREKIRRNERLMWWSSGDGPESRNYRAFKSLAVYFAKLLVRRPHRFGVFPRRQPSMDDAIHSLLLSTSDVVDWAGVGDKLRVDGKLGIDPSTAEGAVERLLGRS